MKKIAVIGAGISGLTIANLLSKKHDVVVFEKDGRAGGLLKCKRVGGSLFHTCGGHVFNTKYDDVNKLFWSFFDCEKEFHKSDRNSVICFENGGLFVPYPIENHVYFLPKCVQKSVIKDFLQLYSENISVNSFGDFLQRKFGKTLYDYYFQPYNEKVWHCDLNSVPLSWLDGKLPMPSIEEILYNNFNHIKEKSFVHSSFYYENIDGSQFIIDRLCDNIDIRYDSNIQSIGNDKSILGEKFDIIIYAGNIKFLPPIIKEFGVDNLVDFINNLQYHGTTSVFCEIDKNPYSWIYLPSNKCKAHRIICTGNFAKSNNAHTRTTGTIEYTDYISVEDLEKDLINLPLNPTLIDYCYNQYTYPIQTIETRNHICELKNKLSSYNIYLLGRFAEWEYYNMDVAMKSAIDLAKNIENE